MSYLRALDSRIPGTYLTAAAIALTLAVLATLIVAAFMGYLPGQGADINNSAISHHP